MSLEALVVASMMFRNTGKTLLTTTNAATSHLVSDAICEHGW